MCLASLAPLLAPWWARSRCAAGYRTNRSAPSLRDRRATRQPPLLCGGSSQAVRVASMAAAPPPRKRVRVHCRATETASSPDDDEARCGLLRECHEAFDDVYRAADRVGFGPFVRASSDGSAGHFMRWCVSVASLPKHKEASLVPGGTEQARRAVRWSSAWLLSFSNRAESPCIAPHHTHRFGP